MNELKYRYYDWFAEINHDAPEDREELSKFFDSDVKDALGDHAIVGVDSTKQKIYHVCYDCNIKLWNKIFARVKNIAEKCEVNMDWNEIKPFLKFTFIWMPPGGDLVPHTAHHLQACSAFNIPLRGKTVIDLYDEDQNGEPGEWLESHRYHNPTFLNVNKYHGVQNNTENERMILKTHMMPVPFEYLVRSYEEDQLVSIFPFRVPWKDYTRTVPDKRK